MRDRDIQLIADAGSSVSHTPTSEATRGGGITPVKRMLQGGVNVALGTDGPMVDTSVDMVEQMKAARLFQNQLHLDPMGLDPWTSLEMATIRAARSIGMQGEIGSIEVGKRADIAVFDITTPWSTVNYGVVGALVHSVRGLDATHVFVDGVPVLEDRQYAIVTSDELTSILDDARGRGRAAAQRAGLISA